MILSDIPMEFEHQLSNKRIPWKQILLKASEKTKKGEHPFIALTSEMIALAMKERRKKTPNLDVIRVGLEACISRGQFETGLKIAEGFNDFYVLTLKALASFTISEPQKIRRILALAEEAIPQNPNLLDKVRLLSVRILAGAASKDENVLAPVIEFDGLLDANPDLIDHPIPETIFAMYVIGIMLFEVGQYDHARKTASVLDRIGRVTRRKTALILAENLQGHISNWAGNFQKAESHYKQVLKLSKQMGHKLGLGIALNNLGSLMLNSIRLEEAYDYLSQAERMFESDAHRINLLGNLSEISFRLGNETKSMEYIKTALELQAKTGKQVIELHILMAIMQSKGGAFKDAREQLRLAKKIADATGISKDKAAYLHAKGVVSLLEGKSSVGFKSLNNALRVATESGLLEWIIRTLLELVRFRLSFYTRNHNRTDLKEAWYHLENLIQIAKEQKLDSLRAESLLLRSDLHLLTGSVEKAREDLERVDGLAAFTDNAILASKVHEKRELLAARVLSPSTFQIERFSEFIERASGFHPVRQLEEIPQPELHVLIAVNRSSGLPEFVHHFDNTMKIDSSLLSGFISAITSFSSELMSTGFIRSINQEGFTLLLEHTNNRIVALITTMETFEIRYKLHEFAVQYEEIFPASKDAVVTREYSAAGELVRSVFHT